MDIVEILRGAPENFVIQDALTKCNSMINNRQRQHILCMLPRSKEQTIITDMIAKCDLEHKVDYEVNSGETYDLVIGPERQETTTSYTECAGDGLYRPCFWFSEEDLDEYIEYYGLEK